MATTTVSIGSNQNIDTAKPSTCTGSGPFYTVTWDSSISSDVGVGDIVTAVHFTTSSTYTYLITAIHGTTFTLKYASDTASTGDDSPCDLCDDSYCTNPPDFTFKRAFSQFGLFEGDLSTNATSLWANGDDVVGVMRADTTFTAPRTFFDSATTVSSVRLTAQEGERHKGSPGDGDQQALIKPTNGSGHNNGIVEVDIDDFTIEWIEINLDDLDSTNTNKAVLVRNNYNNCVIRNNLIHDKEGNPGGTGPFMIHFVNGGLSSDTCYIFNNFVYNIVETSDDGASAINTNLIIGISHIYNNTVYNLEANGATRIAFAYRYGSSAGSVNYIRNNIATKLEANSASDQRAFWKSTGGATEIASNNLSDDTSDATYQAPGTGSLVEQSLVNDVKFVSTVAGSEDLHLQNTSVCVGAGYDVGSISGINFDIDGLDRNTMNVNWDMGADQTEAHINGAFFMFLDV